MKKNRIRQIVVCLAVMCASLFAFTACGGDDFESYMSGQPALDSTIDAELSILSCAAKGSVQYEGDIAKVKVDYYALTKDEIGEEETAKCTARCNAILKDAIDQYKEDTGRTATVEVTINGHDKNEE